MNATPASDPLNDAQRRAVAHGDVDAAGVFRAGPLLVIAGAGSGKTGTLAHRVARLLLAGVRPERLLLLTFSRRAAAEMTRRAERIVAEEMSRRRAAGAPARLALPWSGTFHAVGARLLRIHAGEAGLDPAFGILDRGDAADLMDIVRNDLGLSRTARRFPGKDTCLAAYSHCVNTRHPLQQVLARQFPWCSEWHDELRRLYRAYVERKQAERLLDYDDLLLYWQQMLTDEALARRLRGRFDQVLVDEYQDTNVLQDDILRALKPDGAGLTVVGDDAQSIYSFRGATVDNILEFPARFTPPATVVTLEDNYRSTAGILAAANALMSGASRQYRKTLRAARGDGARPQLVTVLDDAAQAAFVVERVLAHREAGTVLRRQAVLFRNAHDSDLVELELLRRGVPFVKFGGLKFLEAAHVKDLLALLRFADNPRHAIAAFRALKLLPGFGPATAQRAFEHVAAAGHSPAALAGFVPPPAARPGWPDFVALIAALAAPATPWAGQVARVRRWYEPQLQRLYDAPLVRAADLDVLERIAAQYPDRERFLTELTLDPPQATGDLCGEPLLDDDYLVLSTVHSAKGQEWDAVFLLCVSDGHFPSEFATGSDAGIEEERRLLYVAMTRARDALYLVEPQRYYVTQQARRGDRHVYGARSRFLGDDVLARLDRAVLAPTEAVDDGAAPDAAPRLDIGRRLREMW
jgi:DNA helicase-2/ATP-dependent DNA helicase PcrA